MILNLIIENKLKNMTFNEIYEKHLNKSYDNKIPGFS